MTIRIRTGWLCASVAGAILLGCRMLVAAHALATTSDRSQSDAAAPGLITGRIHFQGTAPKLGPIVMDKDPVCAAVQSGTVWPQDGEVNTNGTLPNAFVYIKSGSGNLQAAAPTTPATLRQKGCMYEPHVLGIMVGQPFEVVTFDPTTHNIHVMAKVNREWNVTQPPGAPPIIKKFNHPEVMVPVRCNVHPWMKAYIGVLSNPYYAVTGPDGSFIIQGIPPGEYTLAVWTATFGAQEKQVTVRPGESTTVVFTLAGH